MGKESLLKSTAADTDKKTTAKKKPATVKKKAPAKKTAANIKPAAAKKTTATKKRTVAKKATTKKPALKKSPKAPAKTAAKKTSPKSAAKPKATVAAKAATTPKAKAEPKPAIKKAAKVAVKPAPEKKAETKPAPRTEAKPEPKAEVEPAAPVKSEIKPEPKPEPEQKAETKVQPKPAPAVTETTPPPKPAPKKAAPPVDELPPAPPSDTDSPDPITKMLKYAAMVFVALMLTVVGASWVNTGHYYLESVGKDLQIYQGRFSPIGRNLLVTLPGVAAPKQIEDLYSAKGALVFAFQYYLKKANALSDINKTPDFDAIKTVLNQALQYAATDKMRTLAQKRLSRIDVMLLVYKSDAAAAKNTIEGVSMALGHLGQAAKIVVDSGQKRLVAKRVKNLEKLKADLQPQ